MLSSSMERYYCPLCHNRVFALKRPVGKGGGGAMGAAVCLQSGGSLPILEKKKRNSSACTPITYIPYRPLG